MKTIRQKANMLGVGIDVINFEKAIARIEEFIKGNKSSYVCVNSIQDIMIAQKDKKFKEIINCANMATPDGWPVVWGMRAKRYEQKNRVTGPDLMLRLCEHSLKKGYSHFFYGGEEGVPQLLEKKLKDRFPGLQVAGAYSPPFRPLGEEEDNKVVDMLNKSGANILWVGLGTPKQHFWIRDHLEKVKIPVMIGVGAAFDFHSGRIKRAPRWMQDIGLEWFHRLCKEPRRLWRRYLEYIPGFAVKFIAQYLGLKKYSIDDRSE